jgi:ATP-dependent RNA helicase RhlE
LPETTPSVTAPFSSLGLIDPLLRALHDAGYPAPTPIQVQAIPLLLEGRDLVASAKTGTGKTAAFALPILQRLTANRPAAGRRGVRVLVLVPTRELATQVAESFQVYGRRLSHSVATVFGGVGQAPQVRALARGVEIVVATPGRLLDLMGQGHARLDAVETLVLDEADHMLDLGFIPDVRRVIATLPRQRQTLLFSATMPPPIAELARRFMHRPAEIYLTPPEATVETIDQRVHFVSRTEKPELLARLLNESGIERALVFTRTKRGADRVAKHLAQRRIRAQAIHGNKSQGARDRTLLAFRRGEVKVLVATDIAARGIDVDGISHVFNFELPNVPETYVHRIGRTARAGASGVAISLCDPEERSLLRDIERRIRHRVAVAETAHGSRRSEPEAPPSPPRPPPQRFPAHDRAAPANRAGRSHRRWQPRGRSLARSHSR